MSDPERDELRRLRGQVRRVRAVQRKLTAARNEMLDDYGDGLAAAAGLIADALKPTASVPRAHTKSTSMARDVLSVMDTLDRIRGKSGGSK